MLSELVILIEVFIIEHNFMNCGDIINRARNFYNCDAPIIYLIEKNKTFQIVLRSDTVPSSSGASLCRKSTPLFLRIRKDSAAFNLLSIHFFSTSWLLNKYERLKKLKMPLSRTRIVRGGANYLWYIGMYPLL